MAGPPAYNGNKGGSVTRVTQEGGEVVCHGKRGDTGAGVRQDACVAMVKKEKANSLGTDGYQCKATALSQIDYEIRLASVVSETLQLVSTFFPTNEEEKLRRQSAARAMIRAGVQALDNVFTESDALEWANDFQIDLSMLKLANPCLRIIMVI